MKALPLFPASIVGSIPRPLVVRALIEKPLWDAAEYPVADPHGGLLQMAKMLGLSAKQADAPQMAAARKLLTQQLRQPRT